jgi:hypothetical protein
MNRGHTLPVPSTVDDVSDRGGELSWACVWT